MAAGDLDEARVALARGAGVAASGRPRLARSLDRSTCAARALSGDCDRAALPWPAFPTRSIARAAKPGSIPSAADTNGSYNSLRPCEPLEEVVRGLELGARLSEKEALACAAAIYRRAWPTVRMKLPRLLCARSKRSTSSTPRLPPFPDAIGTLNDRGGKIQIRASSLRRRCAACVVH